MGMDYLSSLTPDERSKLLREAQETKLIKREAAVRHAEKNLKLDWDDIPHWKELASKHGVRLPIWYLPADVKQMRKIVRKLGKDRVWWSDEFGFSQYKDHLKANPSMPAFAFAGFCLEAIEEALHENH
jgi:hypothetical protein